MQKNASGPKNLKGAGKQVYTEDFPTEGQWVKEKIWANSSFD